MRVCEGRVCMSVSVSVCPHMNMHTAFLGDPRESVVNELARSRMWVQRRSPAPRSGERVSDSAGRGGQGKSAGAEPRRGGRRLISKPGLERCHCPSPGQSSGSGIYRWVFAGTITSLRQPAGLWISRIRLARPLLLSSRYNSCLHRNCPWLGFQEWSGLTPMNSPAGFQIFFG